MNNNVIPMAVLIVAIGIFFFYVNPTWSGPITSMKAAIASDDKALAAAITYAAQQNALATARNAIDPNDLSRLAAFLPSSVDNVGLILDLNALAARSGLALSNIDVMTNTVATKSGGSGALTVTNSTGSVNLALSAVGTYSALQTFLRGVEKSQRLLDVRELVVKGSDTGVYTYQMKIMLYWLH